MNATRAAIAAITARATRKTEDILAAHRAGHLTSAERDQGTAIARAVADAEIRQARRGTP